jgi:HTH-type transcriptional regulator / antitoxin HigA
MANSTTSYQPDFVTPPGDTLAELLEERGITQSELAQRMRRPLKTINGIVRGKKALTPETALQLERVLSVPASFWLNREQRYQEHLARRTADLALQTQRDWVDRFPIKDMQAKGWLPAANDKVTLLVALLQFFGLAEPSGWQDIWSNCLVNYRKTAAYESSDYALSVWLRQGELEAQDIICQPYNPIAFKRLLSDDIRSFTCQPPETFVPQLITLCASVGVAAVFVPQVEGARVSGATRWLTKDKALIQLSLRYKTNDHFWFTFFHEAGHIVQHGKREFFINVEDGVDSVKEQEANQFAANALIPLAAYNNFVQGKTGFSAAAVNQFAQEIGVAPGIIVGRLQHDRRIPYKNLNGLKERFVWGVAND